MSQENTKYCKHCGQLIDVDCIVCPKCGKQVEELKTSSNGHENIIINNNNNASAAAAATAFSGGYNVESISPKSWLTTLLLCLFLGGLGIHRFYVGKIGTGLLMILLMFTGIGEVWLIIDFIVIIVGKFTDKQGRPIKR